MSHIPEKYAHEAPKRIEFAKNRLEKLGIAFKEYGTALHIQHKGETIYFYPYSGWHSGKSIKDGRGIDNLLKQIL